VIHPPVTAGVYREATAVRWHVVYVSDAAKATRKAIDMGAKLGPAGTVIFYTLLVAFALAFKHWDRGVHATTVQATTSLPDVNKLDQW
jgi:hypothetical protein